MGGDAEESGLCAGVVQRLSAAGSTDRGDVGGRGSAGRHRGSHGALPILQCTCRYFTIKFSMVLPLLLPVAS